MRIEWLGHASFLITTEDNLKIVTDPYEAGSYDGALGYGPLDDLRPDIVTISHSHADHNYPQAFKNKPQVLNQPGEYRFGPVEIKAISSFHDNSQGSQRGPNLIFVFSGCGLKLAHLGDLGTLDVDYQLLQNTDILLLPVGGVYTLGPEEAKVLVEKIKPKVVIPMHFKTEKLGFPIAGVEEFTSQFAAVEFLKQSFWLADKDNLPDFKIIVFKPAR